MKSKLYFAVFSIFTITPILLDYYIWKILDRMMIELLLRLYINILLIYLTWEFAKLGISNFQLIKSEKEIKNDLLIEVYKLISQFHELVLSNFVVENMKMSKREYLNANTKINEYRFKFNLFMDRIKNYSKISLGKITSVIDAVEQTTTSANELVTDYFHLAQGNPSEFQLEQKSKELLEFVTSSHKIYKEFEKIIVCIETVKI